MSDILKSLALALEDSNLDGFAFRYSHFRQEQRPIVRIYKKSKYKGACLVGTICLIDHILSVDIVAINCLTIDITNPDIDIVEWISVRINTLRSDMDHFIAWRYDKKKTVKHR